MAEIRIKIPDNLDREIREFDLDVSGAVVESIREELAKFIALKVIAEKSKLTDEDAIELGRKLKEGRAAKLKKEGFL